jgi:hypothetical protein
MDQRILEHYRNWLREYQEENDSEGENQVVAQTPDENLQPELTSSSESDQPSASNEFFFNFPIDSHTDVKVYENSNIEIFIRKSFHQRQKKFRIEDSMFHLKVKVKNNQTQPLLYDLLDVFERSFEFILKNLKSFFNPEDINELYMTLFQNNMINGLNTPGMTLQDDPKLIVDRLLDMLYRFLISESNIDLAINDSFKVYIHVLSIDHVQFKKRNVTAKRKNYRKKQKFGSNKKIHSFPWAVSVPDGYGKFPTIFKDKCLIVAIILGHLQNEYYRTNRLNKKILYAQNISSKSVSRQIYAGNIIKKELNNLSNQLNLSEGPYDLNTIGEKICGHYKCQLFVYSGIEETTELKTIIPSTIDDSLEKIPLYIPYNDSQHIVFIRNLSSFFKTNRKICSYCRKKYKNYKYIHRCIP